MAYFDRAIPPGGEGKVTLRINTKGYEGEIRKRARVYTNDPHKSIEVLTVRAFVKGPISLTPRSVYLKGKVGRDITKTVRVSAEENKPLKLEPSRFSLSDKVRYRIEEVEAGREFRVHFTGVSNAVGTYRGFLKLKTNYPERPEITIWIKARFLKSG
ncbi:MAG: hypothetical protein HWN71_06440 [Desulfobacterales bacterium]|nr:hypothetical protein [Desulfobacterales bacterium]